MSMASIKASFAIWSMRDNPVWDKALFNESEVAPPISQPSRKCQAASSVPDLPIPSREKSVLHDPTENSNTLSPRLIGIVNKGNTHASSIIQCLFSLPSFRALMFSISSPRSSLSKSFLRICQSLKTSKHPVDPSVFLSALRDVAIESGKRTFDISRQHDGVEILECMLSEFAIDSPFAGGLFDISVIFSRQCESCYECSLPEDTTNILKIPEC